MKTVNDLNDLKDTECCGGKNTRLYSIFFPFWCICFYGGSWIWSTLAVSLVLDGACLMAALLLFRPRRGGADVGGAWRRCIIPFCLCDILAMAVGGGALRLSLWSIEAFTSYSETYLVKLASSAPFYDLWVLVPVVLSAAVSGAVIYFLSAALVFKRQAHPHALACFMALTCAPYTLLIPSLFDK